MPDFPNVANRPPEIEFRIRQKDGHPDPAKRIDYSRHRFQLPKITGGGVTFVWPVGIEGFTRLGSATLGIHKYLGANHVDVHLVHLDEAHIEMTGMFPGLTSAKNMRDLITVLVAKGPKQLSLPGVFTAIQSVYCENYNFSHTEDDRTHSIAYSVSFVRTTTHGKVDAKTTGTHQTLSDTPGPPKAKVEGSPDRMAMTTDGMSTFRAVSDHVYDDPDKWGSLISLNQEDFSDYNKDRGVPEPIPSYQLVISRLELGSRIKF
jgi:hypothetical protein